MRLAGGDVPQGLAFCVWEVEVDRSWQIIPAVARPSGDPTPRRLKGSMLVRRRAFHFVRCPPSLHQHSAGVKSAFIILLVVLSQPSSHFYDAVSRGELTLVFWELLASYVPGSGDAFFLLFPVVLYLRRPVELIL